MKVEADKAVDISAVPYYNLDKAEYNYQLYKDNFARLKINYGMTGVGDTPNPTMPEYRVYPRKFSNTIKLVPIVN